MSNATAAGGSADDRLAGVAVAHARRRRGARHREYIDCQSHVYPPVLLDHGARTQPPLAYRRGEERHTLVGEWQRKVQARHTDLKDKLADMDRVGIATTLLSINDPGPECFGADGLKVARMANDFLGEAARAHPGRFAPLAVLPLQDMEASLVELDRSVNQLGARGILLYSNLNGRFPDERSFGRCSAGQRSWSFPSCSIPPIR
jgi:predicted TIM-barrel fold metal-dependent hydrolase